MLKKLSKIAAALVISSCIAGTAAASDASYGLPKKSAADAKGTYSTVVLYNYTADNYTSYATFSPSGKQSNLYVGPYRSGMDIITYNIDYPDTQVCLKIFRNVDQYPVFNSCLSSGNVNIGPYALGSSKPVVNVTK